MLQILDQDGTFASGSTEATLTGNLYPEFGGTPIAGKDTVCIVPGSEATTTSTTSADFTVDNFLFLPSITR